MFNATFNNISVISWLSVLYTFYCRSTFQSQDDQGYILTRGCHDCDRMVVGFTTTYAITAYHYLTLWILHVKI
jgi:hypothetical protein